jgi:hypothetical protein
VVVDVPFGRLEQALWYIDAALDRGTRAVARAGRAALLQPPGSGALWRLSMYRSAGWSKPFGTSTPRWTPVRGRWPVRAGRWPVRAGLWGTLVVVDVPFGRLEHAQGYIHGSAGGRSRAASWSSNHLVGGMAAAAWASDLARRARSGAVIMSAACRASAVSDTS